MKMKKVMAVALSMACAATMLSATAVTASAADKKEVVIWDYFETDAQKEMIQSLMDGFNASQDEYEATHVYVPFSDYEKQLTLGIASGELPDLVILDGCSMASFIQLGLFGDISDADINWDEYIEGPLESTMMDGKHYGIPFATNCTALYYNKDMFDAAGIDYPDENTTWDEFHEMAKALTKDGVYGFGNAATNTDEGTFQCLQWLYTAGGSYTDIEDGVDAYKLMQEMIEDGSWTKECVNWTQSDVNNNFMAGNLAMQQNGPWQIPVIVHVILGLPGEDKEKMLETIRYLNNAGIFGIKLQLLHVLENTDLADEFRAGKFQTLSMEAYVDLVVSCIGALSPDIVIHRLTGDGPSNQLISPLWSRAKRSVLNCIHHELKTRGIYQGCFLKEQG